MSFTNDQIVTITVTLITTLIPVIPAVAAYFYKKNKAELIAAKKRELALAQDCLTFTLIEEEHCELHKLYTPKQVTLKLAARQAVRDTAGRELSPKAYPSRLKRLIERLTEELIELEK